MKVAYLDGFAGLSGDMFLGALIGAGVDRAILENAVAALKLNASLKVSTVDRSGISSTRVVVFEGDRPSEVGRPFEAGRPFKAGSPADSSPSSDAEPLEQRTSDIIFSRQPEAQHQHKTEEPHTHGSVLEQQPSTHTHPHVHPPSLHPEHNHARSLTAIRELIQSSGLSSAVIQTAVHTFELLGHAEARIHNVPVDEIHFHEVGAVDSIVDIVAASAGFHALGAEKWVASPVNVGGGTIDCAHGRFPVPAPASADLLRGVPTYSAHVQMELVTPTGAALLRVLMEEKGLTFGTQPAMTTATIGYGAGSRDPHGFPNVLRLSVGEMSVATQENHERHRHSNSQTVTILEAALDDLSPQVLAHVAELAMQRGALDVMLTPVIMKKGRPGTLITVLCDAENRAMLERLLLVETTTLGIRIREDKRSCLERTFVVVQTAFGQVRIKVGKLGNETLNANPEFEDCRTAAAVHNIPVKQVQQAAVAAYLALTDGADHHG